MLDIAWMSSSSRRRRQDPRTLRPRWRGRRPARRIRRAFGRRAQFFVFDVAHEVNRSMNPWEKSQLRPNMKQTRQPGPRTRRAMSSGSPSVSARRPAATQTAPRAGTRGCANRSEHGSAVWVEGGSSSGARPGGSTASRRPPSAPGVGASALSLGSLLAQSSGGLERRAGGTRTPNRRFWRPVLYQLSYCPIRAFVPSGCSGAAILSDQLERDQLDRKDHNATAEPLRARPHPRNPTAAPPAAGSPNGFPCEACDGGRSGST